MTLNLDNGGFIICNAYIYSILKNSKVHSIWYIGEGRGNSTKKELTILTMVIVCEASSGIDKPCTKLVSNILVNSLMEEAMLMVPPLDIAFSDENAIC